MAQYIAPDKGARGGGVWWGEKLCVCVCVWGGGGGVIQVIFFLHLHENICLLIRSASVMHFLWVPTTYLADICIWLRYMYMVEKNLIWTYEGIKRDYLKWMHFQTTFNNILRKQKVKADITNLSISNSLATTKILITNLTLNNSFEVWEITNQPFPCKIMFRAPDKQTT